MPVKFAYPWVLYITPALIAFVAWYFLRVSHRRRALTAVFAGSAAKPWADPGYVTRRVRADFWLSLAATALLGITLARPLAFHRDQQDELQGVPYLVALDASRSMLAADLKPSRYGAAVAALDRFFAETRADRIGLITFAGIAYLNSPLAFDMTSLRTILRYVHPEDYIDPGSSYSQAIERANRYFLSNNIPQRVLILIGDGEDLEGRPVELARRLHRDNGLKIATIGVGTLSGARVTLQRPGQTATNSFGQQVTTRLNETLLQRIADAAGGRYYRLGQNGEGLDRLRQEFLVPLAETASRENRQNYREFFQLPLALAFACLLGRIVVGAERFQAKRPLPSIWPARTNQ